MNKLYSIVFSSIFVFAFHSAALPQNSKQEAQAASEEKTALHKELLKSTSQEDFADRLWNSFLNLKNDKERQDFISHNFTDNYYSNPFLNYLKINYTAGFLKRLKQYCEENQDKPFFTLQYFKLATNGYTPSYYPQLKKMNVAAPENPMIAEIYIQAALESGDFEDAENALAKFMKTKPTDKMVEMLAECYLLAGKKADALKLLNQTLPDRKNSNAILSNIVMLMRLESPQTALELLERQKEKLENKNAYTYYKAAGLLLSGKEKEAIPLLMQLASLKNFEHISLPDSLFGMFSGHLINSKTIKELGPEFSAIICARTLKSAQGSLRKEFFSREIANTSQRFFGLQGEIRKRNDFAFAINSLGFLTMLAAEKPEFASEIRDFFRKDGQRFMDLYLPPLKSQSKNIRIAELKKRFAEKNTDTIGAILYFNEATSNPTVFTRPELEAIMDSMIKINAPQLSNLLRIMFDRNDFSQKEKESARQKIFASLTQDFPLYYRIQNLIRSEKNPAYQKFLTDEADKNFAQNKDKKAETYAYLFTLLDRDIKKQDYPQFARHLEQMIGLQKEISFPEMIKELDSHNFQSAYTLFYTQPKRTAYLSELATAMMAEGHGLSLFQLLPYQKNTSLPGAIAGTPPLFSQILKNIISSAPEIVYTLDGRITRYNNSQNTRALKQADIQKLWTEIQKTTLKPMAKIYIAILAKKNEDASKLLIQALDEEKNPSTEFLFNALAFQRFLNQNKEAEKMITHLLTLKDLSAGEKQILSFFYLQLPEKEKDLKKCNEFISALAAATKTSADQQAFKTFLLKNKFTKQAGAIVFPKIKERITDISRTSYYYDNNEWNYYHQIAAEYKKNKDAVLKRIKKTFKEQAMRQRRILYLTQNQFYYRHSNTINTMNNTAKWGENKKTFEKIQQEFQNSADPEENLVAALLLDSVMERPAEATAIYEKLLEKRPDDLFIKQRICLLYAHKGPEFAKKIFHNLKQDPLFEIQSLLQRTEDITPEAVISLITLSLDDAESQNKEMSPQEFNLLLSTLSRPYFSKDGKSNLKKLTREEIYSNSDPAEENGKLAEKRLALFNRLCSYGGKHQFLRWSAAKARLDMILKKELPPPRDLLMEFQEVYKLGINSFIDDNFAEFLCLWLIQTREFKEIRAFTSELTKKNETIAKKLNSYIDFTEKMLTVPENEFSKTYESAVQDSNLSLRTLQSAGLNAAAARKINFDPAPVLLTKEMFTKQVTAYPVIDYLNYAAGHLPADRVKSFIIRLYLFYFDNLSKEEQVAWSQSPYSYPGTMSIVMNPVGQYIAFNNPDKAQLTAGLFLAIMDPAMSKLPGKVRAFLFQRLQNSGFSMTSKVKLFDLLKQTPLFAGVADFELPPMENGNMFQHMSQNVKQPLIKAIEAEKEKTFGMKMIRQLCNMWNSPEPLFPVLHEYVQEIKALPQEKRFKLWNSIDTIFSTHSNKLPLTSEKQLAQYPELKKIISEDMKLISDKKYNDFMAIAILNPQNPYQEIQNARLLYQDFRDADPEKAERILRHLIQLAKNDPNTNSALKNYFEHLQDYKLIRLFKQNGITFENRSFNARTLVAMFQKELNSIPQKERTAKFPDFFLEFATTFADKFNDNTVFAILFSSKPSDPAQLKMLAEGFRKRNAPLPAFQTAQKLLNVMCEAAEKKITPDSFAFLNQLLDNTLNKVPGAVEEQWLLRDPELFANSPRAVELFARAVKVLERRTGNNVVKDPAAYANLLFNLTRLKEQMQKEEFIKMAAPFFQNCYENLAVVENKHGELMLPCLIDFYTLTNDDAKLGDLKEYTDLMTPDYFKKIVDGKKFPQHTVDAVKKLFPSMTKEK